MQQRLVSLWRERLSPTQKRLVVVGSVCTLLFTSLYLAVREPTPASPTRESGVPSVTTPLQILATNRLDDFTIASLSNSVNELHNSISQLQEQNATLQAELQALKGAGVNVALAPVEYFPEFNTPEHLAYLSAIMRGLPRIEQLEVYDAFLAQYPERRNQAIEELLGYRQYLYEQGIDETTYLPAIGKGVYPDGTPVGVQGSNYPRSGTTVGYGTQGYPRSYSEVTNYSGFDRLADFTVSNPNDPYAESPGSYRANLSGGVGQRATRQTNLTLRTAQDANLASRKRDQDYVASSRGNQTSTMGAQPSRGTGVRGTPSNAAPLASNPGLNATWGAESLFASLGLDPRNYQRTVQVTEQGWVLITSRGRIDLRLAPAASADWQNTILYAQGNAPFTSYQGSNSATNYDNSYTDPYGTVYNSAGQVQSHAAQGEAWSDPYATTTPNSAPYAAQGAGDNLSAYLDRGSTQDSRSKAQATRGASSSNSSWNQQLVALNHEPTPAPASAPIATPAQPLQIKSTVSPPSSLGGINLPAGAVFTGNLVTGVDAATHDGAKQDPYPVLVKLANLDFLPNNFKSNLESCFLLLSSYGDLSSSRALMRTQSLSCINHAGYIIEGEIKGYAVGADGKLGLRGRLVSKQGSLIAKSLSAGLLQGLGEVLAKPNIYIGSRVNTSTAGDVSDLLTQAGLLGVGKAVDRVANFYLTLANKMFPLVEVGAGANVDVVLTARVQLSASTRRVHATPLQATRSSTSTSNQVSSSKNKPAASNLTSSTSSGSGEGAAVQIRNYSSAAQAANSAARNSSNLSGWTSALPAPRQQLIDQFWQGVQGVPAQSGDNNNSAQQGTPEQEGFPHYGDSGATSQLLPRDPTSLPEQYRGLYGTDDPQATTILEFPAE